MITEKIKKMAKNRNIKGLIRTLLSYKENSQVRGAAAKVLGNLKDSQ